MVYWITNILSADFILIIDIWNNWVKLIRSTNHYATWIFSCQKTQLSYKDLVVYLKTRSFSQKWVARLVLKTPYSRLGPMQDLMVIVMFWLGDSETKTLWNQSYPPHWYQQTLVTKTVFWCFPITFVLCFSLLLSYPLNNNGDNVKNSVFKSKINGIFNYKNVEYGFHFNNKHMKKSSQID